MAKVYLRGRGNNDSDLVLITAPIYTAAVKGTRLIGLCRNLCYCKDASDTMARNKVCINGGKQLSQNKNL